MAGSSISPKNRSVRWSREGSTQRTFAPCRRNVVIKAASSERTRSERSIAAKIRQCPDLVCMKYGGRASNALIRDTAKNSHVSGSRLFLIAVLVGHHLMAWIVVDRMPVWFAYPFSWLVGQRLRYLNNRLGC